MNSASGRRESDLNLVLALAFQEVSDTAPFDVVLLRSVDSFMSLRDRARLANWAAARPVPRMKRRRRKEATATLYLFLYPKTGTTGDEPGQPGT